MISLRPIEAEDILEIKKWPSYAAGFEEMDYALREHGWIDEFQQKPETWIYIAESDNSVIGFSLLSTTSKGEAEFRIAINPNWIGKGMGKSVTIETLKTGFLALDLDKINLIVRKTNHPAAALYKSLGFMVTGNSNHTIQGRAIEFVDMTMSKEIFQKLKMEDKA